MLRSDALTGALTCALTGALLATGCLVPRMAHAQTGTRTVEGRVVRPTATATLPVAGAMVVLHRVAPEKAGPLDSTLTRGDGGYRFSYAATGDSAALYFVSTTRGGVAYFTAPARESAAPSLAEELVVFDTTSRAIRITPQARHVIVTAPDTGSARTIIEVYEISNDTTVTRVARGTDGFTFDAPLPPGVGAVSAGEGDVSPDALRVRNGRLEVTAPLAPGIKRISFYYDIALDDAPIEVLVESPLPVLEVLVEDPRGDVSGAGLTAVDPVSVEGRPFRRFLAKDVAGAQTFSVTAPARGMAGNLRLMLIVTAVGASMLLGLGAAFLRRGPSAFAPRRSIDPEALALEIAALDARFEATDAPTQQQRAEHYLARAHLKGRLSDALAKRDGLA